MKRKIKYCLILTFLLILFVLTTLNSYATTISQNLSNNFFRLHILANSDSEFDQVLKLKVRDNIIKYMELQDFSGSSKEDVINSVQANLAKYQEIAEETIKDTGYNYSVSVNVGNFYFPTKEYGNLSLPSGYYDALRIEIGEAKGQNWWCVMFPPLCFVDETKETIDNYKTRENLEINEELEVKEENKIVFKSKILEGLKKLFS